MAGFLSSRNGVGRGRAVRVGSPFVVVVIVLSPLWTECLEQQDSGHTQYRGLTVLYHQRAMLYNS